MFLTNAGHNRSGLSDEELFQRFCQSRQSSYFNELFARHALGVLSFCRRYLQDEEESRDAVMQVFEKCLESFGGAPVDSFSSWLYSTARNECIDILRRNRRTQNRLSDYAGWKALQLLPEPRDSPDHPGKTLYQALSQLKRSQRECIELFYFEGKSYRQIADSTRLSERAVKTNLQNGKRRLKQLLGKNERA